MKNILLLAILLFTSFGFAALPKKQTFDLKIKLSLNGKLIVLPNFSLPENKIATFTKTVNKEKIYLTVTATEQGQTEDHKSMILFAFNIGTIDASGAKTILAAPKMVTLENETAEASQSDRLGNELLAVSVIANKKKK